MGIYKNKETNEKVVAFIWYTNGDHPNDDVYRPFEDTGKIPEEPREGNIVRYYRHPKINGIVPCNKCKKMMHYHGWIDNGGDGLTVCPGDIIIGEKDYSVMDSMIFNEKHVLEIPDQYIIINDKLEKAEKKNGYSLINIEESLPYALHIVDKTTNEYINSFDNAIVTAIPLYCINSNGMATTLTNIAQAIEIKEELIDKIVNEFKQQADNDIYVIISNKKRIGVFCLSKRN